MNCLKDCVFCSLVNQIDKELCSKPENTVLCENDLVLIKPALGMSIPNSLGWQPQGEPSLSILRNASELIQVPALISFGSSLI